MILCNNEEKRKELNEKIDLLNKDILNLENHNQELNDNDEIKYIKNTK